MQKVKEIKGTRVLARNLKATSRLVVDQGGSRSSKTWSICQLFVLKCIQEKNLVITIARKTMPSLKTSVMRDFFDMLKSLGLYNPENHNRTDNTYKLNTNLIEFVSMDQPQKKRGAKRDYMWLNEANEFSFEDFIQLSMRTSKQVFLDYNPSDDFHWIYERIIPRDDCTFIKSTYKDNPFLEANLIKEIEYLKEVDENYWRIYGLGEKGQSSEKIYNNWDIVETIPSDYDELVYGLDFGYNNPSSLSAIYIKDMEIWIDEIIYETRLTNSDLIRRMKEEIPENILVNKFFKCDSAEPQRIEEICQSGINAVACKKGKNSVKDGIDVLQRTKIHVTSRSVNTTKEIKNYKWKKDRDGNVLDEPVKFMDHAMDGIRYGVGLDSEEIKTITVETLVPEDFGMEVEPVQIGDF